VAIPPETRRLTVEGGGATLRAMPDPGRSASPMSVLTRRALLALPAAALPALSLAAPAHAFSVQDVADPVRPAGGLDWDVLAEAGRLGPGAPVFPPEVAALAETRVKLAGYMTAASSGPSDMMLLSAYPYHCSFCYPGAAATIVPVGLDEAFAPTAKPILVEGRLQLLQPNDTGFLYRLVDARARIAAA
jgi:hypothetical protein